MGSVRLKTGMDRNGPNNRNGPGITGTDLSFTYFFSSHIFISLLFSSYLYAYRRSMHMLAKKRLIYFFSDIVILH